VGASGSDGGGAAAARQLAVQEHGGGRGGQRGPDRGQGGLLSTARHATGADHPDDPPEDLLNVAPV
jgi:hypothetical protein